MEDLFYYKKQKGGTIMITGMKEKMTSVIIPEYIDGKAVTGISSMAFKGNSVIEKITIPSSVTDIEDFSFSNCTSLKEVNFLNDLVEIPNGLFKNCTSLREFNFPNDVKIIGEYAFDNCINLQNVDIPNTVKEIKHGAFKRCKSFYKFKIPCTVEKCDNSILDGCDNLNSILYYKTTQINEFTFTYDNKKVLSMLDKTDAKDLENVNMDFRYEVKNDNTIKILGPKNHNTKCVIPQKIDGKVVTEIADNAFKNHREICEFSMPDTVKIIGENAFENCEMLTVKLPLHLEEIKSHAFKGCEKLREMLIPAKTKKLGDQIFENCYVLNNITMGTNVEVTDNFADDKIKKALVFISPESIVYEVKDDLSITIYTCLDKDIKKVDLPNDIYGIPVKHVGEFAFSRCKQLIEFNCNKDLISIEEGALSNCVRLKHLNINDSLKSIGNNALEYTGLEELIFPEGMEVIKEETCLFCEKLKKCDFPITLQKIEKNAFRNCVSLQELIMGDINDVDATAFENAGTQIINENNLDAILHGYAATLKDELTNADKEKIVQVIDKNKKEIEKMLKNTIKNNPQTLQQCMWAVENTFRSIQENLDQTIKDINDKIV